MKGEDLDNIQNNEKELEEKEKTVIYSPHIKRRNTYNEGSIPHEFLKIVSLSPPLLQCI